MLTEFGGAGTTPVCGGADWPCAAGDSQPPAAKAATNAAMKIERGSSVMRRRRKDHPLSCEPERTVAIVTKNRHICGVDTGGTFTDVVLDTGQIVKIAADPHDSAGAVRQGVDAFGRPSFLAHGTTVATNALLE